MPAVRSASIRDLPSGAGLLALGRDMLLENCCRCCRRSGTATLRLVATAMAIAEREAEAGDAPAAGNSGAARRIFTDAPASRPQSGPAGCRAHPETRRPAAPLRRRPARRRIRAMRVARADRACDIVAAHDIEAARGQSGIPRAKTGSENKARVAVQRSRKPSTPSPAARSSSSPTTTTARTRAT